MATLHLPRNRSSRKKETREDKADRELDEGLKQTFPASDPVAATAPGGPVSPGEKPEEERSGRNPG